MDFIGALTTAGRLPARIAFSFWLTLTVALFGPGRVISKLGIGSLVDAQRGLLGAAWLVLLILVATQLVGWFHHGISERSKKRRAQKKVRHAAAELDPREKSVLREFLLQGQNTIHLPFDHPVVAGMIEKGLLVQVGRLVQGSLAGMLASFAINDTAADLITFELLGLPTGAPTKEEIERIRRNRPEFAGVLDDRRRMYFGNW